MARYLDVCFIALCYYLTFLSVESKIFSKSLEDISLIQKPSLLRREAIETSRQKRAVQSEKNEGQNTGFIHSQNLTLDTTSFSLQGENDNEVFVTWSGTKNDVSITVSFVCSF